MSTWEVILSSVVGILALASTIPVMILLYMHIDMVLSEVTTNEDVNPHFYSTPAVSSI